VAYDPELEPEKQAAGKDEGRGRLTTLAVDLPRFVETFPLRSILFSQFILLELSRA
jgi:hypothetical protein